MPDLQSAGAQNFSIGLDPDDLKEKFAAHRDKIDFERVHIGWNDKSTPGGRYQADEKKVAERAKDVLGYLWDLQDKMGHGDVVVVSHTSILKLLVRDGKF